MAFRNDYFTDKSPKFDIWHRVILYFRNQDFKLFVVCPVTVVVFIKIVSVLMYLIVHDPTSLLALIFLSCINKGCMYVYVCMKGIKN